MAMELGEKIGEGWEHMVYAHTDTKKVIKIPNPQRKEPPNPDQAERDMAKAQAYFAPWLPETQIYRGNGSYFIEQQRIQCSAHIKPADMASLYSEMGELLEANRKAMKDAKVGLDFLGLEGSVKTSLYSFRRYRGSLLDRYIITPALRFSAGPPNPRMPEKTIEWWRDENLTPEITNVIMGVRESTARRLHIIDLGLFQLAGSLKQRLQGHYKNAWSRRRLRKYFGIDPS